MCNIRLYPLRSRRPSELPDLDNLPTELTDHLDVKEEEMKVTRDVTSTERRRKELEVISLPGSRTFIRFL